MSLSKSPTKTPTGNDNENDKEYDDTLYRVGVVLTSLGIALNIIVDTALIVTILCYHYK